MRNTTSNARIVRVSPQHRLYHTIVVFFIFGSAELGMAEIVGTTASASATSREFMDGEAASFSSTSDALLPDASNLPLGAAAELTSTDLAGDLIAMGLAFSDFNDPTRLDQPNPEEFAIEAACYSDDAGVSYLVEATATETRTVRFGEDELDFVTSALHEVRSRIFLSGAVVVWTASGALDLSQLEGEIAITVTRDTTETLFETNVQIAGGSSGDTDTSTSGTIVVEAVTVADLVALGLDVASAEALETIKESGSLTVLIISSQEHTYNYQVEQDREYELTATMSARLMNAPGGSGIAAALGRPFSNVASFIEAGLSGADGESVQSAIRKAISRQESPDDLDPPAGGDQTGVSPSRLLCGAFGLEALALVTPVAFLSRPRRRCA